MVLFHFLISGLRFLLFPEIVFYWVLSGIKILSTFFVLCMFLMNWITLVRVDKQHTKSSAQILSRNSCHILSDPWYNINTHTHTNTHNIYTYIYNIYIYIYIYIYIILCKEFIPQNWWTTSAKKACVENWTTEQWSN